MEIALGKVISCRKMAPCSCPYFRRRKRDGMMKAIGTINNTKRKFADGVPKGIWERGLRLYYSGGLDALVLRNHCRCSSACSAIGSTCHASISRRLSVGLIEHTRIRRSNEFSVSNRISPTLRGFAPGK